MSHKICSLCGKLMLQSRVTHRRSLFHSWSKYRVDVPWVLHQKNKKDFGNQFARPLEHQRYSSKRSWIQPTGFETGIQIYHPIKKEKVPLILRKENLLQWYSCGPTVYDSAHIGHASSYVRQDIIRRILNTSFNIDTIMVMAVTDVEDKIIRRSQETGKAVREITRYYEAEFFHDMAKLNVTPPNIITRVTQHMDDIVDFIKGIEQQGNAYKAKNGSVYFDVHSYGKYGVFESTQKGEGGHPFKRNIQDFALWKAHKHGEPHWDSPWGPGRPGWHIECSAMASKILGSCFDLHSGGEDLKFPHHENELAQSCSYHNTDQWVNYWLHYGHLFVSGQTEKMSKSLKNVVLVSELLDQFSANEFRMLCLLSSYRKRIEFNKARIEKAVSTMTSLSRLIKSCDAYISGENNYSYIPEADVYEKLSETQLEVRKAFADDFNTPKALAHVMRLVKFMNEFRISKEDQKTFINSSGNIYSRSNVPVAAVGMYLKKLMSQLGLDVNKVQAERTSNDEAILNMIISSAVNSRTMIRNFALDNKFLLETAEDVNIQKNQAKKLKKKLYKPLWKVADEIRYELQDKANIFISDYEDGSSGWEFVESESQRKYQKSKDSPDEQKSKKETSS